MEIFNDSPNQTTTVTHILKTLEEGMELYYDEYVWVESDLKFIDLKIRGSFYMVSSYFSLYTTGIEKLYLLPFYKLVIHMMSCNNIGSNHSKW